MKNYTILNENLHKLPVIINLPHSGTFVPRDIRNQMLKGIYLSNTDWFLPQLYDFLPEMGCTTIINHLSRYVVDVNRPIIYTNSGDYRKTVVYQNNTQGSSLYSSPLDEKEIDQRIKQYYEPYHQALEKLLLKKLQVYSKVLLLDLHSFFIDFVDGCSQDVYLSNRGGITSSEQTLQEIHKSFTEHGYSVIDNAIMGGHIIHHYSKLFGEKLEGVLIELRYTNYIENRYFGEEEISTKDEVLFNTAKQQLKSIFKKLNYFQV